MNIEDIKKIAEEEMNKSIMGNLDSAIIFKYISNLENELKKKDKVINEIEDLCIRKSDDEGEEYGGIIIWNFAHKIMEIINKVEREGK